MRNIFLIVLYFTLNVSFIPAYAAVPQNSAKYATIYLYAPAMNLGFFAQSYAVIYINNRPFLRLSPRQHLKFHLPAGHYTFTASTDRQRACNGTLSNSLIHPPLRLTFKNGNTYMLFYGVKPGITSNVSICDLHLSLIPLDVGLKAIRNINQPIDTYHGSFLESLHYGLYH